MACPACESLESKEVGGVRGYRFRRCTACASLYCWDRSEGAEETLSYADSTYFENPDFASPESGGYHGYKSYLGDRPEIETKFHGVLSHLETVVPKGTLLDVGAGPGFLVNAARTRGWNATGLDLNPWAAQYAAEKLGVEVAVGSLSENVDEGVVDALTMMDLIEHVSGPEGLVEAAARAIRPGGGLAILTPDAGSPVSRALGLRWPEVQRVPEHLVLYSVRGLARLLERHGFDVVGWHSVGKRSQLKTLAADVSPAAPALGRFVSGKLEGTSLGRRSIDLDPRTKFCLYARRGQVGASRSAARRPPRLPKRAPAVEAEQTVFQDLQLLASAEGLVNWMFDQYKDYVRGRVAEVGAGIGTFSAKMRAGGAREMLLIEPEPNCAQALDRRFAGDSHVVVARELLPAAPSLRKGEFDLIVCQNVLEHIWLDREAVDVMARALRPGGRLVLLVPAHPRLFGGLDQVYGHYRRYTRETICSAIEHAGLETTAIRSFNALGIPGWWAQGRAGAQSIGATSLALYEAALRLWRPIEDLTRPQAGLSLVVQAVRQGGGNAIASGA